SLTLPHLAASPTRRSSDLNARDMAIVRGHVCGFPVVLSSATPSVESRVNADQGRYERVVLPARFAAAALPELRALDLRRCPPQRSEEHTSELQSRENLVCR